ncbi:MAG: hypothetical protein ABIG61_12085 [Planctomycetota bacterium]
MYAKIFEQIFNSSIASDYETRHVFMDLLVLADPTGIIDMTYDAIARRTNVPEDIIRRAVNKLCLPDFNSRSGKQEGKRLVKLDAHREWGWQVVNFQSYRKIRDENARREYMRSYMRKYRKHRKPNINNGKPQLAHTEEEAKEKDKKKIKKEKTSSAKAEAVSKKINHWAIWVEEWEKRWKGQKPKPAATGPATRHSKNIAEAIGNETELREIYAKFLQSEDLFVKQKGYTLSYLYTNLEAFRSDFGGKKDGIRTLQSGRYGPTCEPGKYDGVTELL